jgi:hypothetical protein
MQINQAPITSRLVRKKAAGWYHIVPLCSRRALIQCDALIQTGACPGLFPRALHVVYHLNIAIVGAEAALMKPSRHPASPYVSGHETDCDAAFAQGFIHRRNGIAIQ